MLAFLKDHGFPHVADSGGCVLHVVANGQKKAASDFESTAELCDDIFSFFHRSHKQTKEFAISQQLSGVAEHVLLRRVPTRWLQQLVVFQRIL